MFFHPIVKRAAVILGSALSLTAPARAAEFSVDPISLSLAAANSSTFLSVINESADPVRFSVAAFAWQQSPSGEMQLSPDDRIIFFPSVFTLEGHGQRRVRIGSTVPAGTDEKAFRVYVSQLPALNEVVSTAAGPHLLMRTRVGIPLFIGTPASHAAAQIANVTLARGTLGFDVQNTGSTHFTLKTVRVSARGADGHAFETTMQGWYVLAGGVRHFEAHLPRSACSQREHVTISASADAASAERTFDGVEGDCGS